jgi:hypothetical protein
MDTNQRQNGELTVLREGQLQIEQRLRYLEIEISKFKGSIVVILVLLNLFLAPLITVFLRILFP